MGFWLVRVPIAILFGYGIWRVGKAMIGGLARPTRERVVLRLYHRLDLELVARLTAAASSGLPMYIRSAELPRCDAIKFGSIDGISPGVEIEIMALHQNLIPTISSHRGYFEYIRVWSVRYRYLQLAG